MWIFKNLVLSFWRKDQGLGMVEAAVTLPLLLLITFGLMEFGNMYISSHQTRDVADVVGDYLQANPAATPEDLQTFVAGLGLGILKNTGNKEENNIYDTIKIQSSKSPMTATDFDNLCKGVVKTWSNPWKSGDYKLYYIHVCYPYTYRSITPLSKLTAGALSETKVMRGKAIAATYPITTCPAGQFVNNNSGKPVCTQVNATCPDGQYMIKLSGTTAVCKTASVEVVDKKKSGDNDCWGGSEGTVVVGMSGGDGSSTPSSFDFFGGGSATGSANKVWCANLTVK